MRSVEDSTVCNNEKLESGSTAAYVNSAQLFFERTIFQDDQPWPTVVWAPSNMVDLDEAPNVQISVSEGQKTKIYAVGKITRCWERGLASMF